MRNRFTQQLSLGQKPISEAYISANSKNSLDELLAALKGIYMNKDYNERIFFLLEEHLCSKNKRMGRKGMDLWCIFVLAQVRLCENISYNNLHNLANNHRTMRHIMGIEYEFGYARIEFKYQNIYDNVTQLSDELISGINDIVVEFGHSKVFKKKEEAPLGLKTDSFVVESNVHFPTDYNLLWDCARKCLDMVDKFLKKHEGIPGWRKVNNWRYEMKGLMREVGKTSSSGGKNKGVRLEKAAKKYLTKSTALVDKLKSAISLFPVNDMGDLILHISLEQFISLLEKHIDLVTRRLLKGEKIPHHEKMFSIFETYTEWVKKGKSRPNVELGKKLSITTDHYNLIVDYELMTGQQDKDVVIGLADRILNKYSIKSWSFDKGYWKKENKELLQLEVEKVVMPKLGKRTKAEKEEETSKSYKRLKNKHSTIESNINELEHRGLNRCPDRSLKNFTKYISLAVCAYNLKKIGKQMLKQEKQKRDKAQKAPHRTAA